MLQGVQGSRCADGEERVILASAVESRCLARQDARRSSSTGQRRRNSVERMASIWTRACLEDAKVQNELADSGGDAKLDSAEAEAVKS